MNQEMQVFYENNEKDFVIMTSSVIGILGGQYGPKNLKAEIDIKGRVTAIHIYPGRLSAAILLSSGERENSFSIVGKTKGEYDFTYSVNFSVNKSNHIVLEVVFCRTDPSDWLSLDAMLVMKDVSKSRTGYDYVCAIKDVKGKVTNYKGNGDERPMEQYLPLRIQTILQLIPDLVDQIQNVRIGGPDFMELIKDAIDDLADSQSKGEIF